MKVTLYFFCLHMNVGHFFSFETKGNIYFVTFFFLQMKDESNITICSAYQQNMKVAYSVVLAGYKYYNHMEKNYLDNFEKRRCP